MNYFRPQPKIKRKRRKGPAYTKFRKEVYARAKGRCETCDDPAPLMVNGVFDSLFCGHVSHKRHGSNKEDTMEAVIWECANCHLGNRHTKGNLDAN